MLARGEVGGLELCPESVPVYRFTGRSHQSRCMAMACHLLHTLLHTFNVVGGPAGSMEGGRQAEVAKTILSTKNVPYQVAAPLLIQCPMVKDIKHESTTHSTLIYSSVANGVLQKHVDLQSSSKQSLIKGTLIYNSVANRDHHCHLSPSAQDMDSCAHYGVPGMRSVI
eukprot:1160729-Pelagomonas_calceolata.AAC.13